MVTQLPTSTSFRARRAGFLRDIASVTERAVRSVIRDPEVTIPALIIPVLFFFLNIGALGDFAEQIPGLDYKAFQLPVAILFAVTGVSRAVTVVTDIQSGYFDRLVISPVNRMALLLGLLLADFALVVALTIPVVVMGYVVGALRTGSAAAVNLSFLLFFPFLFMTTLFLPQEAMTEWLATVADYNPVTYLLASLRSLITTGWEPVVLLKGVGAVLSVGVISLGLALVALRGRATRSK